MEILQADFVLGSTKREHFPDSTLPEIAFIGRSNVGKSSLLNNLVRRKKLALTSENPGKTQQINFFTVNNQWMFVDLPGFGFAKVSKEQRTRWIKFSDDYLLARPQLKLICLLVDCRHDPQPLDLARMEWLELNQRKFVVILTKKDKVSTKEIAERQKQLEEIVQYCQYCVEVLPHSSMTSDGRENLLAIIKRECGK